MRLVAITILYSQSGHLLTLFIYLENIINEPVAVQSSSWNLRLCPEDLTI